tara:strand:+ start:1132 stop:1614 length:483 start_codon:yes stop_codon:yes gene_type:complete
MDIKNTEQIKSRLTYNRNFYNIILDEVADIYVVDRNKVFGGSRQTKIIDAKRLFIYSLRNLFRLTLQEIADLTNLHHASILHHNKNAEFFCKNYIEYELDFKRVESRIIEENIDDNISNVEGSMAKLKMDLTILEAELTKMYNIKSKKDVRKKRESLLAE